MKGPPPPPPPNTAGGVHCGTAHPSSSLADDDGPPSGAASASASVLRHFVAMSVLFAANHGCVAACLSLATARLGAAVGAWQSGLLCVR